MEAGVFGVVRVFRPEKLVFPLQFVLAGAMDNFRFLKPGVALILLFVGAKMIASAWIHPSTVVSLVVIVTILAGAIGLSLLRPGQVDQA